MNQIKPGLKDIKFMGLIGLIYFEHFDIQKIFI